MHMGCIAMARFFGKGLLRTGDPGSIENTSVSVPRVVPAVKMSDTECPGTWCERQSNPLSDTQNVAAHAVTPALAAKEILSRCM